jgi:magnesium transporter
MDGKNSNKKPDTDVCDSNDFIEVIEYDAERHSTFKVPYSRPEEFATLAGIPEKRIRWINMDGQYSQESLEKLCGAFHIHPLVIHNIQNKEQRAKIEVYPGFLYIVAKMIYFSGEDMVVEHINFLLGANYVITIGEVKGDVFDNIRGWIDSKGAHVRNSGADYLIYLLLDAVVEGYFDVLEVLNERIDTLEEQVIAQTSQEHLTAIREIKKSLLRLNRYIWPLRDVASIMGKESTPLITASTEPYLRDVYNHIAQAIDSTETSRELLSSLTDLHISNTSYKLNEIMKVLTIISTIFIPLTFIAGVYGMNFQHMPELAWPWGYGVIWIVMLLISGCMVYYFKRKKWF